MGVVVVLLLRFYEDIFYLVLEVSVQPCLVDGGGSHRGCRSLHTPDARFGFVPTHASLFKRQSWTHPPSTREFPSSVLHSIISASSFNSFISYSTTFLRSTRNIYSSPPYCSLLIAPCSSLLAHRSLLLVSPKSLPASQRCPVMCTEECNAIQCLGLSS